MHHCFFLLFFFFLVSIACAQQHKQEGVVYENKTHLSLSDITIENLNGNFKTKTDKQGRFFIHANVNDLLVFNGFGYKPDTVMLINLNAREFYIEPAQHLLNEVVINGKGASAVNQSAFKQPVDPDFHNQTMIYQRNVDGPNADSSVKGGISLRIWSNKKTEKDAKKQAQLVERDKMITQIQQAFSEQNVGKYIPLKNQELHCFVLRYSPDIKTFTSEDFNMATYISKCYKQFVTLSPEERMKSSIFGN
jgi:hypothetical protein